MVLKLYGYRSRGFTVGCSSSRSRQGGGTTHLDRGQSLRSRCPRKSIFGASTLQNRAVPTNSFTTNFQNLRGTGAITRYVDEAFPWSCLQPTDPR